MNLGEATSLVSAIATVVTAVIACRAARIAYKTLHSWKDKEKFMQLVRLKRSIFSYRQRVEHLSVFQHDHDKINDYLLNVLQPSLTDVYHEMKLVGYKEGVSEEFKIFEVLYEAQKEYMESHLDSNKLLDGAVKLQKKIEVDYQGM